MSAVVESTGGEHVVGVAELCVAVAGVDLPGSITTYALGSCIGLTMWDPDARVAGMLHFMLPQAPGGVSVLGDAPATYAETGIPALLEAFAQAGGRRDRSVLVAAGAAEVMSTGRSFQIGQRNRTMLRRILWREDLQLAGEDTGGRIARTLRIELGSGIVTVRARSEETVLWRP